MILGGGLGIHSSHQMGGILFKCSRCGEDGVDLLNRPRPCPTDEEFRVINNIKLVFLTDEELRVLRNIQSVFDRQQKRASALFMMGGATMFAGDR